MRFFGIATGSHDDYTEHFVSADCPQEAALKFMRSEYVSYNEIATIHEAELNKHGVLHITGELCKVELVGPRGYLWDRYVNGQKRCRLCGDCEAEDDPTFINDDGKCRGCINLKQIKI
jgi:hypothetical protein